jgi:glycosyltransferase involved in cell wall biosynthesis
MKKIKLLHFFAPLRFGGGESFMVDFLRASASSFDNKMALFSSSEAFTRELNAIGGVAETTQLLASDAGTGLRSSYKRLFLRILSHPVKIVSFLRKNSDYDFIVGHGFPFNFILPMLKFCGFIKNDKKMIYYQYHRLMNSSGSLLQRIVYRRLFARFDMIWADSGDVRNDILKMDKSLAPKIVIFSCSLDFGHIQDLAKEKLSTDFTTPKDRVVSVYPARFIPHKNHGVFVKILARLKEAGNIDNFFAIFSAGSNEVQKQFHDDLVRGGYEKNFLLPDKLSYGDLLHFLGSSNVCLFPSLEEGFGLGILEALVLGVPVVCFRKVITPELNAFTMAVDTEEEFIDRACKLISDPGALAEATKTARDRYEELRKAFDLRETSVRLQDTLAKFLESASG